MDSGPGQLVALHPAQALGKNHLTLCLWRRLPHGAVPEGGICPLDGAQGPNQTMAAAAPQKCLETGVRQKAKSSHAFSKTA